MHQIVNITVRFFIHDYEVESPGPRPWEGVARECTEEELKETLLRAGYRLEYERHTFWEHGVNQICLTAMPYS